MAVGRPSGPPSASWASAPWARRPTATTTRTAATRAPARIASPHLHDVIVQRPLHIGEHVRHSRWNDDHVALDDPTALATDDRRTAQLVRLDDPGVGRVATRDERGGALEDIDEVGVERVDLGDAVLLAVAGVNHVIAAVDQDSALLEPGRHHCPIDVRDLARQRAAGRAEVERPGGRRARGRDLLVLAGGGGAADTDGADDVLTDHDRHTAL